MDTKPLSVYKEQGNQRYCCQAVREYRAIYSSKEKTGVEPICYNIALSPVDNESDSIIHLLIKLIYNEILVRQG